MEITPCNVSWTWAFTCSILAIFQALDADPVLNMLVFGESILNDAVAIVLTATVVESSSSDMAEMSNSEQVIYGVQRFIVIFLGSAGNWYTTDTHDPALEKPIYFRDWYHHWTRIFPSFEARRLVL